MARPAPRAAIVASALLVVHPGTAVALPGQPDPTFARGGTFTLAQVSSTLGPSPAIAPMRDGGVLIAGTQGSRALLLRLTQRGRLQRRLRLRGGAIQSVTRLR